MNLLRRLNWKNIAFFLVSGAAFVIALWLFIVGLWAMLPEGQ